MSAARAEPVGRRPPGRPEPLFLLAPARSYSTVCLAMLAGHPDIYGFPELLLFSSPNVAGLLTEYQRRPYAAPGWLDNRLSGVLRAVADLHEGTQSPGAVRRARQWLQNREPWTTVQLMDHLLELAHPSIGLEKSPDTVVVDGALAKCLCAYPGARFIHLTRHPVTTQQSMQRYWYPVDAPPRTAVIRQAASAWHLGHLRIIRALAQLPPDQWIRVRAEDLLSDPDRWLPPILNWLGLDCNDAILARMRQTELWRFAGNGPAGDLYGGDAKFLQAPRLRAIEDPGPVHFPPSWELPERMRSKMRTLGALLGY
jgi:hypothetical protein